MKKRLLAKSFNVLVGAAFIFTGCGYDRSVGSQNVNQSQTGQQSQTSVIRKEGWEIPGLVQSMPSGKRYLFEMKHSSVRYAIQDISGLYVTLLRPIRSGLLAISEDFFSAEEHQALGIEPDHGLSVREIRRYDIDERTFCYVVEVNPARVGKDNKIISVIPMIRTLYFYDEDGDGKFEAARWGESYGWGLQAPQWVRRK